MSEVEKVLNDLALAGLMDYNWINERTEREWWLTEKGVKWAEGEKNIEEIIEEENVDTEKLSCTVQDLKAAGKALAQQIGENQ